jgi:tight adherence protein C
MLILLAALALLAVAATLLIRAAGTSRARAVEALSQIDSYGFGATSSSATEANPSSSILGDIATLIGESFGDRLGSLREGELRKNLMAAGMYRIAPKKLLGYQVLFGLGLPLVWAWVALSGGMNPLLAFAGIIGLGLLGWVGPVSYVKRMARFRRNAIEYRLPELVDLLVVTVEAGLAFSASLRMAADRLSGPLGDELRLTLQEQNMGLSTEEALRNMLERCDTPSMRSFVRAIIQGETLGVSIGQIMRNLAIETRKRRRAAAEEKAQKAPIKLLFPLIFLIFPAMFIILLGPALFAITKALG